MKIFNRRNFSAAKIIIFGYAAIIAVGTLLLCLPISSVSRTFTPLSDAFFTSVSASCVTGLAVFDTYTYWSLFGQLVILTLIQMLPVGLTRP